MASRASGDHMAQLLYKPGQRRHLFAVRQLLQDPRDEDCYVAGPLAGVYSSSDPEDVRIQAARDSSVRPPYAVVHVTGYMLALTHQGQQGFRVWVTEPSAVVHEHYIVSLVDVVRAAWSVRKMQ
jgi:hypothetical protein